MRRSLEDTWQHLDTIHLRVNGEPMPRHPDGGRPHVPERMPSIHDSVLVGLRVYSAGLFDADMSDLTLPRSFFGRSGFERVNFANTDLSESCMCWNDFDYCDFSRADLSGCDMRSSIFRHCRFAGAILRGADLRRSTFEECDFSGADMGGAVAEDKSGAGRVRECLSEEQVAVMVWRPDGGPEPPGG